MDGFVGNRGHVSADVRWTGAAGFAGVTVAGGNIGPGRLAEGGRGVACPTE